MGRRILLCRIIYTLNPSPRMHARWLWTSSRHLSSDSELSYFKKHASLAFFVSGQAQQLKSIPTLNRVFRSPSFNAHGFNPWGLSGFFLGSVGSYGQVAAAGGVGGAADENQPVICTIASQPTLGAETSKIKHTLSTNMFGNPRPLLDDC